MISDSNVQLCAAALQILKCVQVLIYDSQSIVKL